MLRTAHLLSVIVLCSFTSYKSALAMEHPLSSIKECKHKHQKSDFVDYEITITRGVFSTSKTFSLCRHMYSQLGSMDTQRLMTRLNACLQPEDTETLVRDLMENALLMQIHLDNRSHAGHAALPENARITHGTAPKQRESCCNRLTSCILKLLHAPRKTS